MTHNGEVSEDQRSRDRAVGRQGPLDAATARVMTAEVQEAMDNVVESLLVLFHHYRAARNARVWAALGYETWTDYVEAEIH